MNIWNALLIALWVFAIVQALLLFALMRQVGILLLRIGPSAAKSFSGGPVVGETAPVLNVADIFGNAVNLMRDDKRRTLMVFVSPDCEACKFVTPSVKALHDEYKNEASFVLVGMEVSNGVLEKYVLDNGLNSKVRAVADQSVPESFSIEDTPYGVILDSDGIVLAKGIANHREHLESLLLTPDVGNDEAAVAVRPNGDHEAERAIVLLGPEKGER